MRLKFLILLSLIDNFNFYKSTYRPYEVIYGFLPKFSQSSIRVAVNVLLRERSIEKIVRNGTVCFSLTLKGFEILSRKFLRPYQGLKGRWDGKWRIVIFDVSEDRRKERDRLREILQKSGFGRLTNSVYISPFDNLESTLKAFKKEKNEEICLFAFETTLLKNQDQKRKTDEIIAGQVFHLEGLAKKYRDWIRKTKNPRERIDTLISYYDIILREDLALPRELLPDNWPFLKTWSIFRDLVEKKIKILPKKTGA